MIKFALVVPCKNFIDIAFDTFYEHNKIDDVYDGETYQMEEVIVNQDNIGSVKVDADVIITRGLLAQILKSIQGDIPVVEVSVPATDFLHTVMKCTKQFGPKKIGAIGAHNMVVGASELSDLVSTPVQPYILGTDWNGPALVNQALKDGCEVIIGGLNTCEYASMINVDNMLIKTSRESFWQGITAAKRAAQISRKEQEKSSRLKVILDSSREGILSIDLNSKRITMINRRAEEILMLNLSVIGVRIQDTPLPVELKKLMSNNNEYSNEVLKYHDTLLNFSKYFIKVKNVVVGAVVNIQEVQGIQDLESKIRKTIYSKGHVAKSTFDDIIGNSPALLNAIETAKKFSLTDSNVLLIGESGTGKEIFAQSIHNYSPRKDGPFVAVNCAAIPDTLLESELFGYAPGAFTGARKNGKPGFFELAHKGTIFLDEIGEIPLPLQAKLLRAIQEREVMRLGSDSVISVDIRVISATNQNLEALVEKNKFRQDLFFRLDVLRIKIPSLKERKQDIPLLADHFLAHNFPNTKISEEVKSTLCNYNWYGNVRHLFNICERLAVLKCGDTITEKDVEEALAPILQKAAVPLEPLSTYSEESELEAIKQALFKAKYNRQVASELLGISRTKLWRKMREYGL